MENKVVGGLQFEQTGLSEHGWKLLVEWYKIRRKYVRYADKELFDRERKEFAKGLEESVEIDRLAKFLALISERYSV